MRVTVAIPTYNRASETEKTLNSLARLDPTGCQEYEVLLIDNNSTDETQEVVSRLAPLFEGRLRYLREERQGLSYARNRAIAEAQYEIVAYLDDDVDVEKAWLRNLCNAYASGGIAGVGGRAYLVYPGPKPRWLSESIEGFLTKVDLGPSRRRAKPDELYGVNLSFQKEWLHRAGGFRTDVGRIGTTLLGGEDEDMLERVAALGGTILYEPGAIVGHRVPANRLRRMWFWKRCYWGHLAAPRLWPKRMVSEYELIRAVWRVGRLSWRSLRSAIRHGPRSAACFEQLLKVASQMGTCSGLAGELFRHWFGQSHNRSFSPAAPPLSTIQP